MLHQQNVDIVDDDLANKEYDRLNCFRIGRRLSRARPSRAIAPEFAE